MGEKDITLVKNLVKCLSGVDMMLFQNLEQTVGAIREYFFAGISQSGLDQKLNTSLQDVFPDCVCEINVISDIYYLLIRDSRTDAYLLAGPCLLGKFNPAAYRRQLRDHNVELQFHDHFLALCSQCPQITYGVFHQLGTLLAQWMLDCEDSVPHQRIGYQWDNDFQILYFTDQYVDLTQMRFIEQRHENAAALTEAVKHGNLAMAYNFMSRMRGDWNAHNQNADTLRNQKNICIALNTQLRNAAEAAGIYPVALERVFGDILLHIENLWNTEDVEHYSDEIIRVYCELVRNHTYVDLKPFPHLVVAYIKDHLTENLTVRDTAKALLVNPDYLSSCFHKEVGVTFIDFIHRERTAQAAGLLRNTTLQIQEVASMVGYNNTSYFAKQFLRYYQMTPRDYRSNNGMTLKPARG